jgi:hypothetical protein
MPMLARAVLGACARPAALELPRGRFGASARAAAPAARPRRVSLARVCSALLGAGCGRRGSEGHGVQPGHELDFGCRGQRSSRPSERRAAAQGIGWGIAKALGRSLTYGAQRVLLLLIPAPRSLGACGRRAALELLRGRVARRARLG